MKDIKNLMILCFLKLKTPLSPVQDGHNFIFNYTINEPEKNTFIDLYQMVEFSILGGSFLASQLFYLMLCSALKKETLLCINYDCDGNPTS